jgi:hypothetical protein
MTEIPIQIKMDNWAFYVLARSENPVMKCQNVKNLISNLIATMKICGEFEFDAILSKADVIANRAWYELTAMRNEGLAIQSANVALGMVVHIVYNEKFTISKKDSFKGRGE